MRLIDADAFKDAVLENGITDIFNLIKNAPTVIWCSETSEGLPLMDLRPKPQGEWKITDAYPHKVYCDKCFKTYAQANWKIWKDGSLPRNFCPNCGADMRGKEE